jgi:tRNA A-37 threonylcarbamoyl transferase component Bud32
MSDSVEQKEKISLRVTDADGSTEALAEQDSPGQAPVSPFEAGPDFSGRFQVLDRIGEGAMGVVYKVFDPALNKVFAIKVLKSFLAADKQALKRFEREAEAAISLNHHGLVSIYEHGVTADGTPFLLMDYIDGENLAQIISRIGRLEPYRCIRIFAQVVEALQHVHAAGLIHRDIKPRNIILFKAATGEESVKLVDFGIAKEASPASDTAAGITQTGDFLGSPLYMSPEQCHGAELDQRSDIYSAGCVFYEMLTGATPFASNNPVKIVVGHLSEKPTAPSSLLSEKPSIFEAIDRIILRCLEKNPDYRYPSAAVLLQDLTLVEKNQNPFKERAEQDRKLLFAFFGLMGLMLCAVVGASFVPFDTGSFTSAIRPHAMAIFTVSVMIFLTLCKLMTSMRSRKAVTMVPWAVSYLTMLGSYVMLPRVPDEPSAVIVYVVAISLTLVGLFAVFFRYMQAPKESFLAPLESAGHRPPTAIENRVLRLFRTFILLCAAFMALYCKAPVTPWLTNVLPFVGPALFLLATAGVTFSVGRKFISRKELVKPGERWLLLSCAAFLVYIVSDLGQVLLDTLKNNFMIALPQYTPLYSAVVSLEFVSMVLTVAFVMVFLARRSSVSPFGKSDGW